MPMLMQTQPIPVETMTPHARDAAILKLSDNYIPEPNSGCFLWIGADAANGYGAISLPGIGTRLAHRVSYALHSNTDPSGLCVLHSCDNRACVNPLHLRAGTHRDNTMDTVMHGTHANKRKTRCSRGHAYDDANTIVWSDGLRRCRTCRLSDRRAWRAKNRDRINAARRRT